MLIIIIKFILIFTLIFILIQDVKERQVYWFLFPIVGLCCGVLYYKSTLPELFQIAILMNAFFVSILLLIVFLYSKFKLKTNLRNTFGLGDVLIFIALSFSFSTVSFLVIFIFSLFFSLALHLVFKKKKKGITIPLAGYISLFFAFVYISFWIGITNSLYSI